MSFNRAKIQRFNEIPNHTPSPADYNPKLKGHVSGSMISTTERFVEQKSPAVSDNASVNSINDTCFRTPTLPKKKKHQTTSSNTKIKNADIFSDMDMNVEALQEKVVECNNKDAYINELTEQIEETKLQIGKLKIQKEDLEKVKGKFEKFVEQLQEEHKVEITNMNVKHTSELIDLQNEIINSNKKLEFAQTECDKLKADSSKDKCNEIIEGIRNEYESKQKALHQQIIRMNSEMSLTKTEWNKLRANNRKDIEDILHNISKFQRLNNVLMQTYNEVVKTKDETIHRERQMIIYIENELKRLKEIQKIEIEELKSKHKHEIEDIEYEMLKNVTAMQNKFDKEKKVLEAMQKVKTTNLENSHKEDIANIQNHADLQIKRIEEDCRKANQLTKLQVELEYNDKENEWKRKLESQIEESEKILREYQALNEFKLMQFKVEKEHLVEEWTDKLKETERAWQERVVKQSKESDEILKECQAISEYNIIQCEIEKNDIKRKLSETSEELENSKVTQKKYLLEKTEIQNACDNLKSSYDKVLLELVDVKNELIREKQQHLEEKQQLLHDKHTYEVTISKTGKTVEALTKRLFDSDKDVEQLKSELENCEKEKLEVEDKCNKLTDELKAMKTLYEDLEYENESNLKLSTENIEIIKMKLLKTVDEYGKIMNECSSDSNLGSLDIEEMKKHLHQQQILSFEALNLIKKANLELEHYEEYSNGLNNKITTLSEELDISKRKIVELEETNSNLQKQLDDQKICNNTMEDTLNKSISKNQEVEVLSNQINQLQEKSDSYYQYCEYYKSKANTYEKEIEDMNKIHKKYIDQSGKYDELLQKYEQLVLTNAEFEKTIAEQVSLIGPFREQLEAYKDELAALEIQKHNAEKEAKIMGLKYAEILGHQNHRQKIKHLVDLKTKNNELHEAKSELEQKVHIQAKSIEKLKKQLASLTKSPKKQKNVDKENLGLSSPLRERNQK